MPDDDVFDPYWSYRLPFWFSFFGRQVECALIILQSQLDFVHKNCIYNVTWREKAWDSIKNKIARKHFSLKRRTDLFAKFDDLFGVRAVVYNLSDAYKIRNFLRRLPEIGVHLTPRGLGPDPSSERYSYVEARSGLTYDLDRMQNRLTRPSPAGYRALHLYLRREIAVDDKYLDVIFRPQVGWSENGVPLPTTHAVICEVQIFTMAQEIWARLSHRDIYKDETRIPRDLKNIMRSMSDQLHSFDHVVQVVRDSIESLDHPMPSGGRGPGDSGRSARALTIQSVAKAARSHLTPHLTDFEIEVLCAAARLANCRTRERFSEILQMPEVKTLNEYQMTADVSQACSNAVIVTLAAASPAGLDGLPSHARMEDAYLRFLYNMPWWPQYLTLLAKTF